MAWIRMNKYVAGIVGSVLAATGAYAATSWVVGVDSGSSAQSQSAGVSNLTISAVASPSPSSLLFPGGTGDDDNQTCMVLEWGTTHAGTEQWIWSF